MLPRLVIPAIVAVSVLTGQTPPTPIVGTISSTVPVTINGSEMSPAAAPSWPLASKDEISTSAPALLQTADRDVLLLDPNSKVRISAAGNGVAYIYIRLGGAHFDAKTSPIYVCIADHLYVPAKSAVGTLRLDASGSVVANLERGAFAEQGARACGQDIAPDFLSGLPKAAGGTFGPCGRRAQHQLQDYNRRGCRGGCVSGHHVSLVFRALRFRERLQLQSAFHQSQPALTARFELDIASNVIPDLPISPMCQGLAGFKNLRFPC